MMMFMDIDTILGRIVSAPCILLEVFNLNDRKLGNLLVLRSCDNLSCSHSVWQKYTYLIVLFMCERIGYKWISVTKMAGGGGE